MIFLHKFSDEVILVNWINEHRLHVQYNNDDAVLTYFWEWEIISKGYDLIGKL
jgi:hypothetical protein